MDYFLARYYSSTQGRFSSPDEFTGGPIELFAEGAALNPTFYADLTDPQSLNKYQYTYNNPLRFTDPNGHCPTCPDDSIKLPTDGAASRVLSVVGQTREVTNNILLGPIGAKASDAAAALVDAGIHQFNKATYGPLGDKYNAVLGNSTVHVADQTDDHGNYLYPDLRLGLGLYESPAEMQRLQMLELGRRLPNIIGELGQKQPIQKQKEKPR